MGGQGQRRLTTAVTAALRALPCGATVVLAVSGGPDSVALAHLVRAARADLRCVVVHVRHGLRNDAEDAAAARACAAALRSAFREMAVRVAASGQGPEATARAVRYEALLAAARGAGAIAVLVGHTADDRAETVLLNIARGAGLPGLAGMPAARQLSDGVVLLRPLLTLRRADVRVVAVATGLPLAHDPTNDDPAQRRSRARHDLLPLLARLTGGGTDAVVALTRLADHARDDAAGLDELAAAAALRLTGSWGPLRCVALDPLGLLPAAVANRVVRRMVVAVGGPPPASDVVRRILTLRPGQAIDLPGGVAVSVAGGWLAVAPRRAASLPSRPLRRGVADLPELSLRLCCGPDGDAEAGVGVLPPWAPPRAATSVQVDSSRSLVVRARRPGDRIRTAAGNQLVADAMISAAVPRPARNLVPVVADGDGPLWVPGVAVRVGQQGPLRLHLEPLPTSTSTEPAE
ncbi:MAG: tRNA lysidine(34) synthetase TilS [Actinomycetota bacterium]|nr:tRNA lysidine(34) synthetase TilS [Euzebyaceae bacterium]MDQ3452951.1 tRNA lysidine(34) synthetase TilS [Actinomycetota bacterium]